MSDITDLQKKQLDQVAVRYIAIGRRTRPHQDHTLCMSDEWRAECKEVISEVYIKAKMPPPKVWFFGRTDQLAVIAEECIKAGVAVDPETGVSTTHEPPPSDSRAALRNALFYGAFSAHAGAFWAGATEVLGRGDEVADMQPIARAVEIVGVSFLFSEACFIGVHAYKIGQDSVEEW